jgi:hypothetical protein
LALNNLEKSQLQISEKKKSRNYRQAKPNKSQPIYTNAEFQFFGELSISNGHNFSQEINLECN